MRKPMHSHDRQAAVDFLSAYANQMDALMALLSRGRSMIEADRLKVTDMYPTLKNALKEDYRRLSRKKSQGEATQVEMAFLLPAVHQASTRLRPATNTNPFTSNWLDAVYSAKIDIDHSLNQLKE